MMGHWPEPTSTLNETLAIEAYNRHNAHVIMVSTKLLIGVTTDSYLNSNFQKI